jgi:hypothetical protein
MTCIVLAYVIFTTAMTHFSDGNFRIGDSIPNNQLVNYVHTCQRLAIIGVTRNTLNVCLYSTLACPLRSCMACYKRTLRKICKLFAEHVSSDSGFFFQFHNYESGRDAVKGWTASLVLNPSPFPHTTIFPITMETYTSLCHFLKNLF